MLTDLADFEKLIGRLGLQNASPLLNKRVRQALHITLKGSAKLLPLGSTRFGGLPDLPDGVGWPASQEGNFTFYGQIDLADVAARCGPSLLPGDGLLSFFAGWVDGADNPVPARVLYTAPGTILTRRPPGQFSEGCSLLEPVEIEIVRGISLPIDDLDFMDALQAAAPGGDTDGLSDSVLQTPAESIGMLLGAAVSMQEDLHAAAAFDALGRSGQDRFMQWRTWQDWEGAKRMELRMQGGGIYRPWRASSDEDVRWVQANRALVEAEISAWELLLQVDSNRAMDLWINDADSIYFFGRRDALSAGDFNGIRARITQS